MPIYEYSCRTCGEAFEALVRVGASASCPKCASVDLERLISAPAIKSGTTHASAMKAAKARDRKLGDEKARAQREYEIKHND